MRENYKLTSGLSSFHSAGISCLSGIRPAKDDPSTSRQRLRLRFNQGRRKACGPTQASSSYHGPKALTEAMTYITFSYACRWADHTGILIQSALAFALALATRRAWLRLPVLGGFGSQDQWPLHDRRRHRLSISWPRRRRRPSVDQGGALMLDFRPVDQGSAGGTAVSPVSARAPQAGPMRSDATSGFRPALLRTRNCRGALKRSCCWPQSFLLSAFSWDSASAPDGAYRNHSIACQGPLRGSAEPESPQ